MKKVSIIGLGWLGMPLAKALSRSGMQVVGSKTTSDGVEAARMSGIECYFLQLEPQINCALDDLEQLMVADVLIITLPASHTAGGSYNYVRAVQLIVDTALSYSVPRIIFTSSTSVYGFVAGNLNEDASFCPETPSAQALVELENWLHKLPNISVDILRLAGLVGSGRHAGRFLAGKKEVKGGDQPVNLVHQDDVISAINLLIQQTDGGHIYNLCAPVHPIKAEFYPKASNQLDLIPPEFAREGTQVESRIVDGSRICKQLGFEYQYPDPRWMPMS